MFGHLTVILTVEENMQIEISNKTHAGSHSRHSHNKYVNTCKSTQTKKLTKTSKQTAPSPVAPVSGQVSVGQHAAIKFIRNPILEGESAHEGSKKEGKKRKKKERRKHNKAGLR